MREGISVMLCHDPGLGLDPIFSPFFQMTRTHSRNIAEPVKQYLGLLGGQKPHFSTVDREQQVVQNGYALVVIAKYNVVQF